MWEILLLLHVLTYVIFIALSIISNNSSPKHEKFGQAKKRSCDNQYIETVHYYNIPWSPI